MSATKSVKAVPPSAIRLTASVFKEAANANARYLLSLEPERLLHNFYLNAGLPAKGELYGGWEKLGIAGHSLGHYLSALSIHYAGTGEADFRVRVRAIVQQLQLCQKAKGNGYVGGIPNSDQLWEEIGKGEIRSQGFDLNGYWVPWYTLHKLVNGLLDCFQFAQDGTALHVARGLADWMDQLLANIDEPSMQRMLACEYGGMNDALARLAELTGEGRYLRLAERFFDHQVLDSLVEGTDQLAGKHANTQIPKIVGLVRIARKANRPELMRAAEFFWERVTKHHSYVIGGNSNHEHFGPPDHFADRLSVQTAETCNTYNMLKLSLMLFEETGQWKYMHFYERAMVNHVLATQDRPSGMTCYFLPLLPGSAKVYGTPYDSFWCCTGTGMENHTKYSEAVAFQNRDDGVVVAQYVPSTVTTSGFRFKIDTDYPLSGKVQVVLDQAPPDDSTLCFRRPGYCHKTVPVTINGLHAVDSVFGDDQFHLTRKWQAGDIVEFEFDWPILIEETPDLPSRKAFLHGPNVLAAVIADSAQAGSFDLVVPDGLTARDLIKTSANGHQIAATDGGPAAALIPIWQTTHQRFAIYFDTYSPAEWESNLAERKAKREQQAELNRRTVDIFRPGEMQSERDHNFQGQNTETGDNQGIKWRHAANGGWFAFEMKTDHAHDNDLILTFWGGDSGRTFNVLLDGSVVQAITIDNLHPGQYFDQTIPIGRSQTALTVKFQARPGQIAGGLYGAKVVYRQPQ